MTALAPELNAGHWFNTPEPLTLATLRGKVVVLHAFQMLCPSCVAHGTPQAEKLHRMFARSDEVMVIGMHTVFEHHAAMAELALAAFIHEYRSTLPIAIDQPGVDGPIPQTMQQYGMRGTPTTIVIDREGAVREHAFGQADDLALGVLVGSLLAAPTTELTEAEETAGGCDDAGCQVAAASVP